jgi:hypothetical protein
MAGFDNRHLPSTEGTSSFTTRRPDRANEGARLALDELWTFVMFTPLVNFPIAREVLEKSPDPSNLPPERDPRRAAIRRLRIASPLEAMLASVAGEIRPFAIVAAGIYVVEHVLHMVMDWQRHRADLGKKIDADAPERDALGVAVIENLVSDSDAADRDEPSPD